MAVGLAVSIVMGGERLATDFRSFWAASKLALQHNPIGAYRPVEHYAVERTAPGLGNVGWAAFFYPPIFLLVCLPLALLPFWWSAVAWIAATGAAFFAAIGPVLPRVRSAWLIAAAFPAAWMSAASGQSSVLAAALFTVAARSLDRRPVLAGVCYGCLAVKPQLGLIVPIALIAAGRWRTAATAALTVSILVAVSIGLFGVDVWVAFIDILPFARKAIEIGDEMAINIPTVAGAALVLGALPAVAAALQVATALAVCVCVWAAARRRPGASAEGAMICVAAMLCSPWLHFYDLTILAFPLVWLTNEALRRGWLPWEKFTVFAGYALPAAISLAMAGLPIAPLVVAALFAVVWRAARVRRVSRNGFANRLVHGNGETALDP
jgi:alpha-1,2-mannosyltransferase